MSLYLAVSIQSLGKYNNLYTSLYLVVAESVHSIQPFTVPASKLRPEIKQCISLAFMRHKTIYPICIAIYFSDITPSIHEINIFATILEILSTRFDRGLRIRPQTRTLLLFRVYNVVFSFTCTQIHARKPSPHSTTVNFSLLLGNWYGYIRYQIHTVLTAYDNL